MKRIVPAIAFLLLATLASPVFFPHAMTAFGQTKTVVSGTIVDPNGVPYAGGSIASQLVPTGGNPTVNGVPIDGFNNPSALDANGHFSISLYCNSAGGGCSPISPGGTKWMFTVTNPGAQPPVGFGGVSFQVSITITGATQDVSSALNAAAVPLYRDGGAAGGSCPGVGATGNLLFVNGAACGNSNNLNYNAATLSMTLLGNGTSSVSTFAADAGGLFGLTVDAGAGQVTLAANDIAGRILDFESTGGTDINSSGNVSLNGVTGVSVQVGNASPITPGSVTQRTVTAGPDAILSTDRQNRVVYNSTTAVPASIATQGSAGFAGGFNTRLSNQNTGTVTLTPATGTINGNATLVILEGQDCFLSPSSAGANYAADCNEPQLTAGTGISFTRGVHSLTINNTGLTGITFPQTVGGTVNSGGIAYFNSTTQMSSSAALTANGVVLGGGAGVAPSTNTGLSYLAGTLTCGIAGSAGCVLSGAGATSGLSSITFAPVGGTVTSAFTFSNNINIPGGQSTGIWGAQNSLYGNTVTKYNNIATVSNGVPSIYGAADLTAQTAAKAATTLFTPGGNMMVRVTIYLKVTTPGTTSVLGGATGVKITYTDATDSVAQSVTAVLQTEAGVAGINNAGNATTTVLSGSVDIFAKSAVAVQYAIDYTSTGTAMAYEAHLKSETL